MTSLSKLLGQYCSIQVCAVNHGKILATQVLLNYAVDTTATDGVPKQEKQEEI